MEDQLAWKKVGLTPNLIEGRLWAGKMSDAETTSASSYIEESTAMEKEKDQQDQADERYEEFFKLYVESEKRIRRGMPNLQVAGTFYLKGFTDKRIIKMYQKKFKKGSLEAMMKSTPGAEYYVKEKFCELLREMEGKYQYFLKALHKLGALECWGTK